MKTIKVKFSLLMAVLGLLLSGCSSDVEQFSCNKEIDGWVKENLGEIRSMNRKDWLNSSWVYSKAIYKAFTPEQAIAFWNEKFEEVMQLPWSEGELKHIQLAHDFLKTHEEFYYEKTLSDDQNDILESFFYKWALIGEREFKWNKKIIKAIVGCGHKVKNTKGDVVRLSSVGVSDRMAVTAEKNCTCSKTGDFCRFTGSGDCIDANCNDSGIGCGWALLQSCNGNCSHDEGVFE